MVNARNHLFWLKTNYERVREREGEREEGREAERERERKTVRETSLKNKFYRYIEPMETKTWHATCLQDNKLRVLYLLIALRLTLKF